MVKSFLLKKGFFLSPVFLLLIACTGQNGRNSLQAETEQSKLQEASGQADILFDTLLHDFGTIIEGEMLVCYFEYENLGTGDLVISSVSASCGCTSPDWSKEPLKPGERDRLKLVFDSNGRSGSQIKSVTVSSNSQTPTTRLSIKANVTSRK